MKFFLIVLSCIFVNVNTEEQVELVIHLFRHGARLSDTVIKLEPEGSPYLEQLGLTPIGMKQQYLLGKKIRKEYKDFLPDELAYKYLQVYTSNATRCIVSARAQIQGLYEDTELEDLKNPMDFSQSFKGYTKTVNPQKNLYKYIYPYKVDINNIQFAPHHFCAKLQKKRQIFLENLPVALTENLKSISNQLESNGYSVHKFSKSKEYTYKDINIMCQWIISRAYLYSPPKVNIPQELLQTCERFNTFHNYFKTSQKEIRQLQNYNLLTIIMQALRSKRDQNTDEKELKLLLLSGHETNIASVLNIFGDFQHCFGYLQDTHDIKTTNKEVCDQDINYSASLVIELVNVIEDQSQKLMIQIKLNGVYLNLFEGNQKIELNNFLTKLSEEQDIPFSDYCQEMFIKPIQDQDFQLQFLTLSMLTIITFILIGVCIYFALGSQEQDDTESQISKKNNDLESQLSQKSEEIINDIRSQKSNSQVDKTQLDVKEQINFIKP